MDFHILLFEFCFFFFPDVFSITIGNNSYLPMFGFDPFGEVSTYTLYLRVSLCSQWTSVLQTFNIFQIEADLV